MVSIVRPFDILSLHMISLYILIIIIFGVFILFRLFTAFFGNWRMTLNKVISAYIAVKELYPNASDKEVFNKVLDNRYAFPNKDIGGLMTDMFNNKNMLKEAIAEDEKISSFKYNLPNLIFFCLVTEKNSIIKKKSNEELINEITEEVRRQGFGKYV